MPDYTITLPELVLDGVRYEPTGEYREPLKGEWLLNDSRRVQVAHENWFCSRHILRPIWTWPEWLKGWGIVKNGEGGLLVLCQSPVSIRSPSSKLWDFCNVRAETLGTFEIHCDFTPPVITDWTKPIINPRWKEPT